MKRKNALRIALVVEVFDPTHGGVERAVWELAHAFVQLGDEVHVIARKGQEQSNVQLHRISAYDGWQPLRFWLFSRAAAQLIASESFDIVHGFARTQRQDIFHAGGGSHLAYMEKNYSKAGAFFRRASPRHRLQMRLERAIVNDAEQRIQCVSEMVRLEFCEHYEIDTQRLFVVPYGVDLDRFRPQRDPRIRAQLRSQWGGDRGTIWLFPGSGFRRKGLRTALEALSLSQDRSAQIWVAGRDKPDPWIRKAKALGVQDRVHFLGPRNDIENLYFAADGVILPTRYDAGALVCLETAASARPLVTSKQCGPAEMLTEAGCVIDMSSDAAAFARALDQFAIEETRLCAGKAGRSIAENHSWDLCAERLRQTYLQVMQTRSDRLPIAAK